MLADTAVAAAPRVSKPPVLRTDSTLSQVSLDRATEQEAIVVDEGFCEVDDPNFGDAASRCGSHDCCFVVPRSQLSPSLCKSWQMQAGLSGIGGSRITVQG